MADNIGYTPGSGATVAADDISGVLYQRMKPTFGEDGVATDVSTTNPLPTSVISGELVETLEALRMALQSLNKTIGSSYPDASGRLRVAIDAITASLTLATITTVGTVTTVSTVTSVTTLANQTSLGGISAQPQIPSLMMLTGDNLRRNVSVS